MIPLGISEGRAFRHECNYKRNAIINANLYKMALALIVGYHGENAYKAQGKVRLYKAY